MEEKLCRGSVVNGYLKYIKKKWGQDGLDEACKAAGIKPEEIKDGGWYPDNTNDGILTWMVENKGKEYIEISNRAMVQDLGMMSYIVRFMDVKSILKRLPNNYKELFNFGKIELELREKSATLKMYDMATSEYSCPAWRGVFKGACDMTKTKPTRIEEIKCQWKGDEHCHWEIEWE